MHTPKKNSLEKEKNEIPNPPILSLALKFSPITLSHSTSMPLWDKANKDIG